MTNICVLTYNRPKLTEQCLRTLASTTKCPDERITIVDDCSTDRWVPEELLSQYADSILKMWPILNEENLGTGLSRNKSIRESESRWGRGDYLYLSDSDVFFLPKWLPTLIECYEWARATHNVVALGAYAHPFLKPRQSWPFFSDVLGRTLQIGELDALPTQSWLWRWEDWDKYGPFCATPAGKVCQSEDVDMSNRIKADGGKVAAIYPGLVVNCGVTNSFAERIPGYDEVMREYLPKGVERL